MHDATLAADHRWSRRRAVHGVIYHHFPGGKSELGAEVAGWAGDVMGAAIVQACPAGTPREALTRMIDLLEFWLIAGELPPGCPAR